MSKLSSSQFNGKSKVNGKGQRKTQDPCDGCYLHKDRCICDSIPTLITKTKLSLIIHYKELNRATNTGTLAAKALVHSEVFIRGKMNETLNLSKLIKPEFRSFLFYPSSDATELTPDLVHQSDLPIQLIVPDGNWRQASKVHYRHKELQEIPRIMISTPNTDAHHLRAESTQYGMATLQAIAEAYGIIEGPDVKAALLSLYQLKLSRTLQGRGVVQAD
jgi:DTW domain-containing protein YfiP